MAILQVKWPKGTSPNGQEEPAPSRTNTRILPQTSLYQCALLSHAEQALRHAFVHKLVLDEMGVGERDVPYAIGLFE